MSAREFGSALLVRHPTIGIHRWLEDLHFLLTRLKAAGQYPILTACTACIALGITTQASVLAGLSATWGLFTHLHIGESMWVPGARVFAGTTHSIVTAPP